MLFPGLVRDREPGSNPPRPLWSYCLILYLGKKAALPILCHSDRLFRSKSKSQESVRTVDEAVAMLKGILCEAKGPFVIRSPRGGGGLAGRLDTSPSR